MSVSILVVDEKPAWPISFGSGFAASPASAHLCLALRDFRGGGTGSGCGGNRADLGRGPVRHQHARDGRAAIAQRNQARFPDLPVMMVTAYGDDERRQAAECGAAEFLTKPVDFEHLKAQLRQLPGV